MSIPAAFTVVALGALPFFEARYAIPFAILLGFAPLEAYALGLLGNILPVIPLLLFLEPVSDWLSARSGLFDRFFAWLFERTRRHGDRFERWGTFALFLFVALPVPVTGAWSGAAAAFIFGIQFRHALPAIAAGAAVAALITTLPTLGVLGVLGGAA
ncbi:MAG: small multi-drug export protein [Methanomicrobiales archaeon]|nr:small multi-drug export protein [Methanomicrobiales archaeon]MDI6875850.1 small multi-drug export protein [Methanomicrobiales archaeon]